MEAACRFGIVRGGSERTGRHHFAQLPCDEHAPVRPVKPVSVLSAMSDLLVPDVSEPFPHGPLTEADAVDIWLARWLRIPQKALLARYRCDPRRLYEVWEEIRFHGSRDKALERLARTYPGLVPRIDSGPHRRIPRTPHPDQLALFP